MSAEAAIAPNDDDETKENPTARGSADEKPTAEQEEVSLNAAVDASLSASGAAMHEHNEPCEQTTSAEPVVSHAPTCSLARQFSMHDNAGATHSESALWSTKAVRSDARRYGYRARA